MAAVIGKLAPDRPPEMTAQMTNSGVLCSSPAHNASNWKTTLPEYA